jgi:hypothetical protein
LIAALIFSIKPVSSVLTLRVEIIALPSDQFSRKRLIQFQGKSNKSTPPDGAGNLEPKQCFIARQDFVQGCLAFGRDDAHRREASMPTRHDGMLAKRASTWPRDHF